MNKVAAADSAMKSEEVKAESTVFAENLACDVTDLAAWAFDTNSDPWI